MADRRTQQAVVRNMLILGGAASRLVERYPEFAIGHADLLWNSMRGMRNRLVHGYFAIDLDVVCETLQRDLPTLAAQLDVIGASDTGS